MMDMHTILEETARREGVTPQEVEREMTALVDDLWSGKDAGSEAEAIRRELFPNGKPRLEEFLAVLAAAVYDPNAKA